MEASEQIKVIDQLREDLFPRKFETRGKIWVALLLLIFATGLVSYIRQLNQGLSVTAMRDYVSWGIYISNFVFFVAISLVGSLITAVLYLLKVEWRAPLTRIAETIAVASIMFAGLIIIVDMGRPDRILHLFIYGRVQSPIVWDVIVVITYMIISMLLLYFPLLPGVALCRDHMTNIPKWQRAMYRILAMGWKGEKEQYVLMHKAVRIMSIMIIPVALSIHTVTSWLFATTVRPGWDSTNFGPYFVSGAFMVGAAGVIVGMYVFQRYYRNFDRYIREIHFDHMGKLLVLLSLIYLYFNVNEYMVPGYKMKGIEAEHLNELVSGAYAPMFWSVQILGMIVPIIILLFKRGRKPLVIFIVSIFVIIGAWFKRYLIVVPTLQHPFLPIQDVSEKWSHYIPTYDEWAITIASLAGALLIMTFFTRYFPIISIWEVAEEKGIDLKALNSELDKEYVVDEKAHLHEK